jgi:hypothetical protein
MDKKLNEYADKFGENFPLFFVGHMDEAEIIKLIDKAIKEDKPYEAEYEDKGDY